MANRPNLVKRRLGRRLTRLRTAANMSPQDVVDARIDVSRSKLWRIESGQAARITMGDVLALCRIFSVQDRELEHELCRMAQESGEQGWWEPYGAGVPAWFQLFVELEQDAAEMRIYESEFINGLFQTEDYMRAVYATSPFLRSQATDQAVALRMARQKDFWSRSPLPQVNLVMSEAAVRRRVGGGDTLAKQIDLLREKAALPSIHLWVIPDDAGAHPSMSRTYTLMGFSDSDDPSVVYSESIDGCRYDDTDEMFATAGDTFNATKAMAIPIEEHLK